MTGQHPWPRPEWKIIPTRKACYWNTNCAYRFRWYDNKIDLTQAQPHYYVVRQVGPCHQLGWSSRALLTLCLNNNNNPVSQWRFRDRLIILTTSLDDHRNRCKSKHRFCYPRGTIEWEVRYLCGTGNQGYNRMRLPPTNRGVCSGYKAMLRCTWVPLYVILPSSYRAI